MLSDGNVSTAALIASSTALLAEARNVLPMLRQLATAPATAKAIREIVGRRFATFPQPVRSAGEWEAWWADYADALAGVPAPAIEAGMKSYVAMPDSEFLPKPGRLLELALSTPNDAARAFEACRMASDIEDRRRQNYARRDKPLAPSPPIDAVEREALNASVTDLVKTLRQKSSSPRSLPPIHGRVDATGITAEMRAHLARRSGQPSPDNLPPITHPHEEDDGQATHES